MFHNVKIVGNRDILLCLAEFKDLSVLNVMVYINLKTIINSVGVAKPMKRPTYHTLKQKKANYAHTSSSILIAMEITRWILIYVCSGNIGSICSGNIGSTKNSTTKSISRSMKTGQNQFAQLWMESCNDLWHFKTFFSKCSQKQPDCQYHSWDSSIFQYCIHSRTSVVDNTYHSELH